jgi:ParB-like chromosome segregation protein Spo0J
MKITEIKTRAPFNEIFAVSERIVEKIAAHIRTHGFDESQPIAVWDEEGVVVDGHTRLQAAIRCSLEEVSVYLKSFADEEEALAYAIHNQRHRRNLTDAEILRCIEAVDKKRGRGGDRRSNEAKSKAANEAIEKVKSAEETARIVGTSRAKVERARMVLADPKATAEVKAGNKTISRAHQEIRAWRKNEDIADPPDNQEDDRQAILQRALDEIRPWKEKYKDYRELSAIVKAIDSCHRSLERMETSLKAEGDPQAEELTEPCPCSSPDDEGEHQPLDADKDESARSSKAAELTDKGPSFDGMEDHMAEGQSDDSRKSEKVLANFKNCEDCRKFKKTIAGPGREGSCEKYPRPRVANPVSCADFEPKDSNDPHELKPEVLVTRDVDGGQAASEAK